MRVQVRSKRREGMLDPHVSPEEIRAGRWSWAWKLDFFCLSRFSAAELRTLSLWLCSTQQFGQQLRSTLVAAQWRSGHCLNIFVVVLVAVHGILVFRVGACDRAFTLSLPPLLPPPPPPPSLLSNLASVDVKQKWFALSFRPQRDCRPPPEKWILRWWALAGVKQLVYSANWCFNGIRHTD